MKLGFGPVAAGTGVVLAIAVTHGVSGQPAASPPPVPGAPPAPAAPASPKLALVKIPPVGASTYPWLPDYLRVLERFLLYHSRDWHEVKAAGETRGYYGAGDRTGVLTQARALLAIAYLAGDSGYDPRPSGVPVATLRTEALGSLRDLVHTHVTGDQDRVGGGRWGDDPSSGLVIGPLVEASRLLQDRLTPADAAALERVVAHEADRLLAEKPASSPPGNSRAPENAASAECLAWAAGLLPRHANASRWQQQAEVFAMNALSLPQDRTSDERVEGRPVRDWVVAENLLPDGWLLRGGAVDPEAELECMAALAGADDSGSSPARPAPDAMLLHIDEAWKGVVRLWLGGQRIARPAGADASADGSDALFPVCALLEQAGSEPSEARLIERNSFQALEAAQMARGDGSFAGGTPAQEAATAASLTLAALLHRRQNALIAPANPEALRDELAGLWSSPAASLAVARSRSCFTSWSWRSIGAPTAPLGLFVPLDAEGLAAWAPDQCIGSFDLQGFSPTRTLRHQERTVDGGFTATGQIEEGSRDNQPGLHHYVAFAALPARRIAVLLDLAVAAQSVTVTRSAGLHLAVRLESGPPHTLSSDEGAQPLASPDAGPPAGDRAVASPWLNVDDRLGIGALYSQEPFTLRSLPPSAGPDPAPVQVVDTPFSTQPASYQAGQIVRDTAILFVAGDSAATTRLTHASVVLPTGNELVRAAVVPGADGGRYLIAANFGLKETTVTLRPPASAPLTDLRLAPLDTLVRELDR